MPLSDEQITRKLVPDRTMRGNLTWLVHNLIVHPICGVLWFVGFVRVPDHIHEVSVGERK